MNQHSKAHERPVIPPPELIAALPPDGGPNWNRLVFEQSPYLLQHAANPVDWYPWGDEAFEKARREDKPVFLSVGYSTCHWCHVMERESFEDEEVAHVLNEHVVAIKVDREERPDIDQVYMTVTQALTGSGGWPMTVVMTPDKKPFFAGTYFPKTGGWGRPGMLELIPALARAWKTQRAELLESADNIASAVAGMAGGPEGRLPGNGVLERAFDIFNHEFDEVHGGFAGGRHKFPVPHNLMFLLRHYHDTANKRALNMGALTLSKMRLGGIFDHVGFGFHRYSTDDIWLLPHFEKMLYDQAMLAMAYCEAYQITGRHEFASTAREVFSYVLRDMMSPEGGFYSAEDADSEGVEGKFYVWTPEEVEEVLGPENAELFNRVYNIKPGGNFHEESTGKKTGESIPHLIKPINELAGEIGMDADTLAQRIELARIKLFEAREKRIHPYKDDKILTDWNGLMIAALAKGAKALDSPEYADEAARAARYILTVLRGPDGRLLKRARLGKAGLSATIEDYAFTIWGFIELYEATFEFEYLRHAVEFTNQMIEHYWDDKHGGFFMTANDAEKLLVRSKDAYDGAIPSGNSVAAYCLARLASMTGRADLREKAARTVAAFSSGIERVPQGHAMMLIALQFLLGKPAEIVVAGEKNDPLVRQMSDAARARFLPNAILLHRPGGDNPPVTLLAEFTLAQPPLDGRATGYVCRNQACELPTHDLEEFNRLLGLGKV